MLISSNLFFFFSSIITVSALFVILSRNPIFSVLFLINTFFSSSCLLFLFSFEFLPISIVIIYVGAVAVLFLFILMMLNVKLAELNQTNSHIFPFSLLVCIFFFFEILSLIQNDFSSIIWYDLNSIFFFSDLISNYQINNYFIVKLYSASNITSVAIALFNNYLCCFVVAGVVLLFAMIGSIFLTLNKRFLKKNQNVYNQLLTNFNKNLINYTASK